MKKMTCLIIDDEPPAIRILEKYLEDIPFLELQGTDTDPFPALARLQSQSVDLLFLDINMPQLSGIDLLRSLSHPPMVIFTTAYPEYAVEGFELEATDYLVKPIARERFLKAVNRAYRLWLAQSQPESPVMEHLLIKADRKIYRIPLDDILFLEAYGDYVKVFCKDQMLLPKETLLQLSGRLHAAQFFRVHRSFIINLHHIEYIEGSHLKIRGHTIPISTQKKASLMDRIDLDSL